MSENLKVTKTEADYIREFMQRGLAVQMALDEIEKERKQKEKPDDQKP